MKRIISYNLAVLAAFALPIAAQRTIGNDVGDFSFEALIPLSGINSLTPPNVPQLVLNAIAGGALEVHQQYKYDSAQRLLKQVSFVLPGKSPMPTPSLGGIQLNDSFTIQVSSAIVINSPKPAVVLSGTVVSNDVETPFGGNLGAGYTLSFAFDGSGDTTHFGPIMETTTGMYTIFETGGIGSLSMTPSVAHCSVATIQGSYMYTMTGSTLDNTGNAHPYSEDGQFVVDGNGNGTVKHSGNQGGKPFVNDSFAAMYTLDDNCSGTITFGPYSMAMQASKDGKNIQFVWTNPATIVAVGIGRLQ
jgi:hypothetical protein